MALGNNSNTKKKKRNNTTTKLENRIEKAQKFLVTMEKFPDFKKTEASTVKELTDLFASCEQLIHKQIITKSTKQSLVALRAKRYTEDADGLNKCLTRVSGYIKNKKGVPQATIDLVAVLIRVTRNSGKNKLRKEEETRLAADPEAMAALGKFIQHGGTYTNRLAILEYIMGLLDNLGTIYIPNNKNIKLPRLGKLYQELVALNKKVKVAKEVYKQNLSKVTTSSKKLMVLCSKVHNLLLAELEENDPRASILKGYEFV
ncbi:MAG: hypothetical protein OIF50_03245 [Flavobacteriaceae bacterium]|nr:hypothetical protein [Flavobacteriaceae bacterium]